MNKRLVPQLSSWGISHDYNGRLNYVYSYCVAQKTLETTTSPKERESLKKAFGLHTIPPLPRYSDVYSPDEFINPVNLQNERYVKALDMLADRVNAMIVCGVTDYKKYLSTIDSMYLLITGDHLDLSKE